jgi:hypothetical protein
MLTLSGEIGSTRVRRAVGCGDLSTAARLLGRPFALWGIIATESTALWAKEIQDMDGRAEDGPEFSELVF